MRLLKNHHLVGATTRQQLRSCLSPTTISLSSSTTSKYYHSYSTSVPVFSIPSTSRSSLSTSLLCPSLNITSQYSQQQQCRSFASRTIKVPSMGDSITEGSLNEWKKQPGDYVNQDEVVAIIDTDKVSVDINAPISGTIESHLAKPGDNLLVGAELFTMSEGGEKPAESPKAEKAQTEKQPETKAEKPKEAAAQPDRPSTPPPSSPSKSATPPSTSSSPRIVLDSATRTEERVPMSRLRKRIAERLKSAQNTSASLTTFQEVDMGNLIAMRSELNSEFVESHKMKFGFVSAFLYSSARALQKMPQINAYISEAGDEIIYKNYVDISVAVATPTGLLVPIIRDCERKSLAELESDLVAIAKKAREGKIALEEMAGGTFTISNGGIFGSLLGTPILNPPQSSILGLHSIKDRPVAKDGEVVIRPMMYLALTYDHRLVDGREAVLFLNRIKNGVEDPRRLLLDI